MRPAITLSVIFLPLIAWAEPPSPTDLNWLRTEAGDGALATQSEGKIYLTELANGNTTQVGNGLYPEFSPDSSRLAWIDGNTVKGRLRKGDSTVHTIATNVTANGGVHWVSDDEVVVVKSGSWRRFQLAGGSSALPELTALGLGGNEVDVKLASGVWSYVEGQTWKTSGGGSGATGGTCSSSLRSDGKSVTGLHHGHKTCSVTRIRTGGAETSLSWVYDYNNDKGFDNHRFSSNDPRFVAAQDEKYNYLVIMKVGSTYCTRMGPNGSGEMYGDFTVGDGAGPPWPGTEEPLLQLDKSRLTFRAEIGTNPSEQTVAVTNNGTGTTDDVTTNASESWLTVTRSGSGNNQTLSNSIDIVGLAEGSFTASVEVLCANASNAPLSYTVELTVEAGIVNQPPEVDAGPAQLGEVDQPLFLAGTVTDDGLPNGTLDRLWAKISGPGEATFSDATALDSEVRFSAAGQYTLQLEADDGALIATDEMEVIIQDPPSISLTSPNGGEVLVVGSTHDITWRTVNLDDVQIDFVCDETSGNIAGSVDTSSSDWERYPWSVPSTPATNCRVQIAGYFGEAPTASAEPFTIRAADPQDPKDPEPKDLEPILTATVSPGAIPIIGGCTCTQKKHLSLWSLLLRRSH